METDCATSKTTSYKLLWIAITPYREQMFACVLSYKHILCQNRDYKQNRVDLNETEELNKIEKKMHTSEERRVWAQFKAALFFGTTLNPVLFPSAIHQYFFPPCIVYLLCLHLYLFFFLLFLSAVPSSWIFLKSNENISATFKPTFLFFVLFFFVVVRPLISTWYEFPFLCFY